MNRGWSVLPVRAGDKRPALTEWKSLQRKAWGAQQINQWWGENPSDNVGIITGKVSGIWVLDIDGEEGITALKQAGIEPPPTYTVRTPHGLHYYYTFDPEVKQGAGLLDHVDIRSEGGYVVAPPSIVDGILYEVVRDIEIATWTQIPEKLIRSTVERASERMAQREPGQRPQWVTTLLMNGAAQGMRNDSATKLAGYLHRQGLPADVIEAALTKFAELCDPPFPSDELRDVIRSVTSYRVDDPFLWQGEIIPQPLVDSYANRSMRFRFEAYSLEILLEKIETRGYSIKCLATVTVNGGQGYVATLDLLSFSQQGRLKKELGNNPWDWHGILSYIAQIVRRETESSASVINLAKHEPEPDGGWIVDGFFRGNAPFVMFGDGGEGKSTLLMALLASISTGTEIIPGIKPIKTGNVLYCDWEQSEDDAANLVLEIAKGAGIDKPDIVYVRMSSPFVDNVEFIKGVVKEHDIAATVYDSVVGASGDDVKDDISAQAFFQGLREIGVPSMLVMHVTKENTNKPYGNSYYYNFARGCWKVEGSRLDNGNGIHVEMFNTKMSRGVASPSALGPFAWDLAWEDGGLTFKKSDNVSETPVAKKAENLWNRIKGLLARGDYITVKEIGEELERPVNRIHQVLKAHMGDLRCEPVPGSKALKYALIYKDNITPDFSPDITPREGDRRYPLSPIGGPAPDIANENEEENEENGASKEW
tara:strand:- start:4494 stop:6611 length:2118 start_codon:yes stop_codon:yes gene_type:complete